MTYHFDFSFLAEYWPDLLTGLWLTVRMTLLSVIPGFALGTLCALGRIYGGPRTVRAVKTYVSVIRNTPLLIQVFWLFFGLSALQLHVPALLAAVVALVINVGAYTTEIMRSGFESIPGAQREAAESLALTQRQMIWHVELPQAIERVYPALVSQFVLMLLATSIMCQISADELTGVAEQIQAVTFRSFEAYAVIALLYLGLVSLLRLAMLACGRLIFPGQRAMRSSS